VISWSACRRAQAKNLLHGRSASTLSMGTPDLPVPQYPSRSAWEQLLVASCCDSRLRNTNGRAALERPRPGDGDKAPTQSRGYPDQGWPLPALRTLLAPFERRAKSRASQQGR
jgi:hypothetical protein